MNGGVTVTWRNNSDLPDHLHHKPGHKGLWQLRIGPNGRVLNEEEYVARREKVQGIGGGFSCSCDMLFPSDRH